MTLLDEMIQEDAEKKYNQLKAAGKIKKIEKNQRGEDGKESITSA